MLANYLLHKNKVWWHTAGERSFQRNAGGEEQNVGVRVLQFTVVSVALLSSIYAG